MKLDLLGTFWKTNTQTRKRNEGYVEVFDKISWKLKLEVVKTLFQRILKRHGVKSTNLILILIYTMHVPKSVLIFVTDT